MLWQFPPNFPLDATPFERFFAWLHKTIDAPAWRLKCFTAALIRNLCLIDGPKGFGPGPRHGVAAGDCCDEKRRHGAALARRAPHPQKNEVDEVQLKRGARGALPNTATRAAILAGSLLADIFYGQERFDERRRIWIAKRLRRGSAA